MVPYWTVSGVTLEMLVAMLELSKHQISVWSVRVSAIALRLKIWRPMMGPRGRLKRIAMIID